MSAAAVSPISNGSVSPVVSPPPNAASGAQPANAESAKQEDAAASANSEESIASRVLRIAKERKRLLNERNAHKEDLKLAETARKAREAASQGDYIKLLEAQGLDVHDVYNKLTDQILTHEKKAKDPAETAREAAKKLIEEERAAASKRERVELETAYVARAFGEIETNVDKYPGIQFALATGKLDRSHIFQVAEARNAQGLSPQIPDVLKFIEEHFAAKRPPKAAASPPPSALSSNTPVAPAVNDENLTADELFARAKAKYLKQ